MSKRDRDKVLFDYLVTLREIVERSKQGSSVVVIAITQASKKSGVAKPLVSQMLLKLLRDGQSWGMALTLLEGLLP